MIHAKPKPEKPTSVTEPWAFIDRLETMANDDDYAWARDTIEGIYATVNRTGLVTAGQLRAIDNIEEGAQRHSRGSW